MSQQTSLPIVDSDPVSSLAEFEQILASHSGEDPFDIAVKLLAAKLLDELLEGKDRKARFRAYETPEITLWNLQLLYKEAAFRWPTVDGNGGCLSVEPNHLMRAIRPLLGWKMLRSDLKCLDATLERLIARDSKGHLGQYFTPRDVIEMCVSILAPRGNDRVIDPACGSGGFLSGVIQYSAETARKTPVCLGIDYSPRAIRVASLLAAANEGSGLTICQGNSIDGRAYFKDTPQIWNQFLSDMTGSSMPRARSWGAWNRLGCTLLLTNPPFAGEVDDPDVLLAYETEQETGRRKSASRECLFLERTIHMLEPGGRMAIVLPQGVLANSSTAYIRRWLLRRCILLGVVGLHQYTFLPYTGVKTCVLFLTKPRRAIPPPVNYPVFFAASKNSGKDSSGRKISDNDYREIACTFSHFLESQGYVWANPKANLGARPEAHEIVDLEEVMQAERFDAEYFEPDARRLLRNLHLASSVTIAGLSDARVNRFRRNQFHEVSYIDISSVDSKTGIPFPETITASEAPSRASYLVQTGDVLVSTVRPDRNVVALVTGTASAPRVASNGFCILRPNGIQPEALFAYCKTESFRRILSRAATASMYPTVSERDILNVPIQRASPEVESQVEQAIKSALVSIEKAYQDIASAISLLEKSPGQKTDALPETPFQGVREAAAPYGKSSPGRSRRPKKGIKIRG